MAAVAAMSLSSEKKEVIFPDPWTKLFLVPALDVQWAAQLLCCAHFSVAGNGLGLEEAHSRRDAQASKTCEKESGMGIQTLDQNTYGE